MANDISKVSTPLLAQGLMALRSMNVMPRLVNSDYQGAANERNSVINVPIPSAITATAVVPGFQPPAQVDLAPTSVPIILDQWFEAPFFLTDNEVMQAMNGVIPMQASEAVKAIANQVNAYIMSMGRGFGGFVGTSGTTPFATDTSAASLARKVLNKQLCPPSDRRIVLDMDAEGNAIILPLFQQANTAGTDRTQVEGVIGRKIGFDWYSDQQVGVHTSTPLTAGALTVNGVNAAGSKVLNVSKATTAAPLVAGDAITIGLITYVVAANTTLIIGNTAVPLTFGLVTATVGGEAITLRATYVRNLAFHRDVIAFATRPLLEVSHPAVISESATDPVSGIGLRLQITREYMRTRFAFDILYGGAVVRPELGCIIAG